MKTFSDPRCEKLTRISCHFNQNFGKREEETGFTPGIDKKNSFHIKHTDIFDAVNKHYTRNSGKKNIYYILYEAADLNRE